VPAGGGKEKLGGKIQPRRRGEKKGKKGSRSTTRTTTSGDGRHQRGKKEEVPRASGGRRRTASLIFGRQVRKKRSTHGGGCQKNVLESHRGKGCWARLPAERGQARRKVTCPWIKKVTENLHPHQWGKRGENRSTCLCWGGRKSPEYFSEQLDQGAYLPENERKENVEPFNPYQDQTGELPSGGGRKWCEVFLVEEGGAKKSTPRMATNQQGKGSSLGDPNPQHSLVAERKDQEGSRTPWGKVREGTDSFFNRETKHRF